MRIDTVVTTPPLPLDDLLGQREGWSVSLYQPTHRIGNQTPEDRLRFKNLVTEAERRLVEVGMRRAEAERLLRPAYDLEENAEAWRHMSEGLAVFVSRDGVRRVHLPYDPGESVTVGQRFRVRPLLPLLGYDERFLILALSKKHVRLYRATRFTLDEVKVKGLPESLDEALKWDDPQDQLQMHSAGGGPAGGRGRRPMLFHGHAVGTDDERSNTERFLRAVHDALRGTLIDEGGPLVLAGVDYLTHAYRDANSYPGLASHSVSGNPDEADVHELHAKAWKVVEPELSRPRAEAATRVEELRGNGGRSTVDLTDVVAAAHRGQVDVLFVATDLEVWGVWNASEGTVQVSEARDAGDVDLLELAATAVLERRGTVYAVKTAEIPGGGPVAALLRY